MIRKVNKEFWEGKKVFLTGHTGFKGSWLSLWLQEMGSKVKGFSLLPLTNPSLFNVARVGDNMLSDFGDIRDINHLQESLVSFNPDILIHMAAQPLVRLSYTSPLETYQTNVIGTANVLEIAKYCPDLKSIVSVTTDKCYENKEWLWGYREDDPLGGHDPYSSSKACAELVTLSYRRSFFNQESGPALATARAGNVIGGGDWSSDRLIPDILRAFEKEKKVTVRNPQSTRPWQHVLEPLSGYLMLAEDLYNHGQKFAQAWNFGPNEDNNKSVSWILTRMINYWGHNASWESDKNPNPHEATFLKLDCSKAQYHLGWMPQWHVEDVLKRIVAWHKHFINGNDMKTFTIAEINEFNK